MADLIQLFFENGDIVRCADLDDAKLKANLPEAGRVVVEIIPEGGGKMITLKFDKDANDWVPE